MNTSIVVTLVEKLDGSSAFLVGVLVGALVGASVGKSVGTSLGVSVGASGALVGASVGTLVGVLVSSSMVAMVGTLVVVLVVAAQVSGKLVKSWVHCQTVSVSIDHLGKLLSPSTICGPGTTPIQGHMISPLRQKLRYLALP